MWRATLLLAIASCNGVCMAQLSDAPIAQKKSLAADNPFRVQVTQPLHVSSVRPFEFPPFGYWGVPLCDSDGNLYFHAVPDMPAYDTISILRLDPKGKSSIVYRMSAEYSDYLYQSASVSPSGLLYVLAQARTGEYAIVSFKPDGFSRNPSKLSVPDNVVLTGLAAFDDESVLVQGHFEARPHSHAQATDHKGERYLALVNSSGEITRTVEGKLEKVDLNAGPAIPPEAEGALVTSAGNAIVISGKELLILSQSAVVERKLPFERPDTSAVPVRLQVSGGLVAIEFVTVNKQHEVQAKYLVLNLQDGRRIGLFAGSDETGTRSVCFQYDEGFVFLQTDPKTGKQNRVVAEIPSMVDDQH